jgi:hypothetical protein
MPPLQLVKVAASDDSMIAHFRGSKQFQRETRWNQYTMEPAVATSATVDARPSVQVMHAGAAVTSIRARGLFPSTFQI